MEKNVLKTDLQVDAQMEKTKKVYQPLSIEVIEVLAEKGYAVSPAEPTVDTIPEPVKANDWKKGTW